MAAMAQASTANAKASWRPALKADEIREGKKLRLDSWATAALGSVDMVWAPSRCWMGL